MPLNLYRRHRNDCIANHKLDSQTYESDELRPKWKKCGCEIYASGKLGDNPKFRKNTKRIAWAEAREVAQGWERGDLNPPPPPVPTAPAKPPKGRVTLAEAIEALLTDYKGNGSSKSTWRRYKITLKKFSRFAAEVKGYVYLDDDWTRRDLSEFRKWCTTCKSERTLNANEQNVKSLFNWCVDEKMLARTPFEGRRRRRNRTQMEAAEIKQRYPFSDDELDRMLKACDRFNVPDVPWAFTGKDLKEFILIDCYTGLRISDMAVFNVNRLTPEGFVHVRAIKNRGWVDTWVPEYVADIIRKRAEKFGPFIFGKRDTTDPQVLGAPWRDRLNKLWAMCGPWEEKPEPHRFRHTFARILLENGTPIPEVAALLGDTEEVVAACYATWNQERNERVRNTVKQAFKSKAKLFAVK
jgi:integrase